MSYPSEWKGSLSAASNRKSQSVRKFIGSCKAQGWNWLPGALGGNFPLSLSWALLSFVSWPCLLQALFCGKKTGEKILNHACLDPQHLFPVPLDMPWPLAMWLYTMSVQTCGTFRSRLAGILDSFLLTNLFFCFLDISVTFYEHQTHGCFIL